MLDLGRQYAAVGAEIERAVAEVCASGRFILGREVGEFETAAAAMLDCGPAVGCASGTDALWLAMAALGVGEGDAVVTTPFSFFATVSSILRVGARPVLADIDPASFNLSPAATADAIAANPDVRAVMPVHLYGQCADWQPFAGTRARAWIADDRRRCPGLSEQAGRACMQGRSGMPRRSRSTRPRI